MKKIKNKFVIIALSLILILGVLLRFYDLGKIPGSLDWDEAAIGYNAYSILETGMDEYGTSFPSSFKSFGDYKQPLYIYSDIIPVKIFGETPFAVRFPSALYGSLSVLFVFLLVIELFRNNKNRYSIALLSAFLFAISPWSIQFSRVAFEANLGVFLIILGAWSFLRGLNTKNKILLGAGVLSFGLSIYAYHSEKVFVPLLFISLLFYAWKFFSIKKTLLVLLLGFFVLLNLFWALDSKTLTRGQGVLFLSNSKSLIDDSFKKRMYDIKVGDPLGRYVLTPKVVYAEKFLDGYFSHFSLNWFFLRGDNPRHHAPDFGLLYLFELPLILIGAYWLIRNKDKSSFILFPWLLLAPIASALAIDAPSAVRSEVFLPLFEIFSAVGLFYSYLYLRRNKIFPILVLLFLVFAVFNFMKFVNQYYVQTNADAQSAWQYGYQQAIDYSLQNSNDGSRIFFADNFEQPYIFYLFYSKYDAGQYISNGGSVGDSIACFQVGKVYFGKCLDKIRIDDLYLSLYPVNNSRFENIHEIKYAYGDTAVFIYKFKK